MPDSQTFAIEPAAGPGRPLRVLVNMPSQYGGKPSGVARVAFCLLAELVRNPSVTYVLRSPWRREQLPLALQGSRLEVVTVKRPGFMVLDVIRQAVIMPFIARKLKTDIILNIDPFGAPSGGRARLTIVHDLYFKTLPDQIGAQARLTTGIIYALMTRGSTRMLAVSDSTRRDLTQFYPAVAGKSSTIHSASTLTVKGEHVLPRRDNHILIVGNATSNKNFGVVAVALKALIEGGRTDLTLVHVGEDAADTLAKTLGASLSATHLRRLQRVSDDDLAQLYRQALCLCVPSLSEGFCLPILEAQGLGCPVVTANVSAMPEIAGDAALYFDPWDVRGLEEALGRLADDADLRAGLVAAGLANFQRFSWARAAGAYEREILALAGISDLVAPR